MTPPPELVQQLYGMPQMWAIEEAFMAGAQWGADRELDACCEWLLIENNQPCSSGVMRAARRPKPRSLKEQALEALAHILNNSSTQLGADTIRRALEQLPE
jgi:hypothetical protein